MKGEVEVGSVELECSLCGVGVGGVVVKGRARRRDRTHVLELVVGVEDGGIERARLELLEHARLEHPGDAPAFRIAAPVEPPPAPVVKGLGEDRFLGVGFGPPPS